MGKKGKKSARVLQKMQFHIGQAGVAIINPKIDTKALISEVYTCQMPLNQEQHYICHR